MPDNPLKPKDDVVNGGFITPRHGHGRLRPFQKGQSGNPGGVAGRYGEVMRMARKVSPEIMRALITIALDPAEDTRGRIVAGQEILNRAFGKPREMDLAAETPVLNATGMTEEQLRLLLEAVRAAQALAALREGIEPADDDGDE